MKKTPNDNEKKDQRLEIRVSLKQKGFIKRMAEVYANGDVSEWCRQCLLDPKRKFMKKK